MKKHLPILACIVAFVLLLGLTAGLSYAQEEGDSQEPANPQAPQESVQNYIPVQGRITNASGVPFTGDRAIKFLLYDQLTGGNPLCSDTNLVHVTNGLFNSEIWGSCADHITGTQLYLGIQVESDAEMTPRQPIYAVPYAWSLKPNAVISATIEGYPILHIENTGAGGRGLRSYATSSSGVSYGVIGASKSPNGFGGYFYDNGGGTGLRAESNTGAALSATGSGIIRSTAETSLWISGNGLQPFAQADTTIVNMDTVGGAKITRGAPATTRNVILPVTIPGPLYGQNVTITGLDIYWSADTALDGITAVLVRRQTGVCATSSCYASLLNFHSTTTTCEDSVYPTGCTLHFDLTSNNILSVDSGILYITLELNLSSTSTWIDIGGARLTLQHD